MPPTVSKHSTTDTSSISAGNTVVVINTDHDKAAEMTFVIVGGATINAADFIAL